MLKSFTALTSLSLAAALSVTACHASEPSATAARQRPMPVGLNPCRWPTRRSPSNSAAILTILGR